MKNIFAFSNRPPQRSACAWTNETRLEVTLPESEFGEDMVTGGFERYKGLSVEQHNECLEELMEAVCYSWRERGLAVACVPDEDVIFYLPLGRG